MQKFTKTSPAVKHGGGLIMLWALCYSRHHKHAMLVGRRKSIKSHKILEGNVKISVKKLNRNGERPLQ